MSVENIVRQIEDQHSTEAEISKVVQASILHDRHLRDSFPLCANEEYKLFKSILSGRVQIQEVRVNLNTLIHKLAAE